MAAAVMEIGRPDEHDDGAAVNDDQKSFKLDVENSGRGDESRSLSVGSESESDDGVERESSESSSSDESEDDHGKGKKKKKGKNKHEKKKSKKKKEKKKKNSNEKSKKKKKKKKQNKKDAKVVTPSVAATSVSKTRKKNPVNRLVSISVEETQKNSPVAVYEERLAEPPPSPSHNPSRVPDIAPPLPTRLLMAQSDSVGAPSGNDNQPLSSSASSAPANAVTKARKERTMRRKVAGDPREMLKDFFLIQHYFKHDSLEDLDKKTASKLYAAVRKLSAQHLRYCGKFLEDADSEVENVVAGAPPPLVTPVVDEDDQNMANGKKKKKKRRTAPRKEHRILLHDLIRALSPVYRSYLRDFKKPIKELKAATAAAVKELDIQKEKEQTEQQDVKKRKHAPAAAAAAEVDMTEITAAKPKKKKKNRKKKVAKE